jgi:hypothetical protein
VKYSRKNDRIVHLGRRATIQIDRCWLHIADASVQCLVTTYEIRGGRSGAGASFTARLLGWGLGGSLLIIISSLAHTHIRVSPPLETCINPDQVAHYHTLIL